MYSNSLLGMWPFIFRDNPTLRRFYNIYSNSIFAYFMLFILSTVMQLYVLLTAEEIVVEEVVANMAITLLYPITARRVWVVRSAKIRNLIEKALAREEDVLESRDEEIIKIYKWHTRQSQITNLLFICGITIQIFFYFTHPLYVGGYEKIDSATNQTIIVRPLPMSSWFPYNPQEHYAATYMWQLFDGIIGASYVMFVDALSFSMIIFPLGQIRILIHILSNFSRYAEKIKDQIRCSREEANFVTLRECVRRHKEIIGFLEDYNESMKNIMVLDFLQSSLQLASIVMQLVGTKLTLFNVVFYGEFAICMLIRLFVYYWYANEIMLESINISTAIYECGWYDETRKVKQLMSFVMMRANRPLGLDIGPFTTMTLDTFLKIIKTTYSYMMIMYNR